MRMRIALLATLLGGTTLCAQTAQSISIDRIGTDSRWSLAGRTATQVDIKGKRALELSEGKGMGVAWLQGYDFRDGTIDVDLLGRSAPVQGSFLGVAFHLTDSVTFDAVYFRPFNFRATDSTRHAHAVQYVSQPAWPWDKLRNERSGQFEQAVMPEPDGDQWFHARIVVDHGKVSVFVNGNATPALVVNQLSDRAGGAIGLWVGEGSGGHFANLKVTRVPR